MSESQSVVLGESVSVEWPAWTADEIAQAQLDHVEIGLDAHLYHVMNLDEAPEYQLPRELLTIGTHAVRGRVCRADGVCGEWEEIVFQVTPIAPGLVRDFQLRRESVPVTPEEAAEMAHSYAWLALRRRLTDPELLKLAEGYGSRPLTHGAVLAYLDEILLLVTTT